MVNVKKNLLTLKEKLADCEVQFNRTANSVVVLAVTKGQPIEAIQSAIACGQTRFGENYLQEALPKIKNCEDKNVEWHFIGTIQSNKTKKISEHFSWAQSVTDKSIAKKLNDHRPLALPPLNICIEVNISSESTKHGVTDSAILELAAYCQTLPRLKLRGLMAIPRMEENFAAQCKEFSKLAQLYQYLISKGFLLDTLSMGMSDDWVAAVAEGATMIRIGTAIFGLRK